MPRHRRLFFACSQFPLPAFFIEESFTLENRIDHKYRDALGKLVNEAHDPAYIIKWKDMTGWRNDRGR